MSGRIPALLVLLGVCGTSAAADPVADISRCAAVSDRDARLSCYDELGSRYSVKKAAPTARTATPPGPTPAAPTPSAAPTAAATSAKATSPVDSKADFGLAGHQKPKEEPDAPKKVNAIEGLVSGFGHSPTGHQVIRVDNSQSWELLGDAADPLLVVGNKVSIRKAMLGSFVMTTPSGRELRVKRVSAE